MSRIICFLETAAPMKFRQWLRTFVSTNQKRLRASCSLMPLRIKYMTMWFAIPTPALPGIEHV
jgi:hypothetical protein